MINGNGQFNVLLVDDERNVISSLSRLFKRNGYNTFMADGGAKGLDLLKNNRIDVLISDMRMPGMNGDEFLEKSIDISPDTVRLLLTGYSDIESTINAINDGQIYRYIRKPWEDSDVLEVVRQALYVRDLEKERERLLVLTHRQNQELKSLNEGLENKVNERTDALRKANKQLECSLQDTIRAFISLIGTSKGLSGEYAKQVAKLSKYVAISLGLPSKQVKEIYYAGLLHELGKVSLPERLLNKHISSYNQKDLEIYKQHTIYADSALTPIELLNDTAEIVRAHEEYYDGSGFPDGLVGEQIPIGARILSVTKAFLKYQSLTNKVSDEDIDTAIEQISLHARKRHDPKVVDALITVVRSEFAKDKFDKELKFDTRHLQPGMILSRDLYSVTGALLLTSGRVLSENLISKLIGFEKSRNLTFKVYVTHESSRELHELEQTNPGITKVRRDCDGYIKAYS